MRTAPAEAQAGPGALSEKPADTRGLHNALFLGEKRGGPPPGGLLPQPESLCGELLNGRDTRVLRLQVLGLKGRLPAFWARALAA